MLYINSKERVFEAALNLFTRYGYNDVEIVEIAFDSNVSLEDFYTLFSTEEELYQQMIQYILEYIPLYNPNEEDISYILQSNKDPADILKRFMHIQDMGVQDMNRLLFRFAIMYLHESIDKGKTINPATLDSIRHNLEKTLTILSGKKVIPCCDHNTLANIWYHSNFMLEHLTFDHIMYSSSDEYHAINRFFIGLATRGYKPLDTEGIKMPTKEQLPQTPLTKNRNTSVIEKAVELFNRHGYAAVSMEQIAEAAGLSPPNLYSRYLNKADIISSAFLLLREYSISKAVSTALKIEDPKAAILYLANTCLLQQPQFSINMHKLMFKDLYTVKDLFELFVSEIYREINIIEDTLHSLMLEGKIKPCAGQYIAMAFVFSIYAHYIDCSLYENGNLETGTGQCIQNISLILGLVEKL